MLFATHVPTTGILLYSPGSHLASRFVPTDIQGGSLWQVVALFGSSGRS